MSATIPDLETASAEEVLAYAVERFHPRLTMACSFQKEESVLLHMLTSIEPDARVFTIDTGVLFPETLETWKRFEERFGGQHRGHRRPQPRRAVDDEPVLQRGQGRRARARARRRRRLDHRHPPRAGPDPRRRRPSSSATSRRGIWKVNPLADWTEKDLWRYIFEHDLPYNPLHDQGYASIGCEPCTRPGVGPRGPLGRAREDRVRDPRVEADLIEPTCTTSSRTSRRSRPSRSTSSARSRPSSSGRCCCSAAARTRSCCCGWPRRRSARAASRSRSCTSTPATTSPR